MATYKVVDADKLDTDLKAVADSIRAKGGTTENLDFPVDFVSAVGNIETGGGAKEEQEKTVEITKNGTVEVVADEGKSMSKVTVNTNVAFEGDIGKPYIDSSKMTNFYYFFNDAANIELLNNIDTSNGTNFSYMFRSCSAIETIPQLDTSKGTNFSYMFRNCSAIETIPQLDTSNGTNFSGMIYQCGNLEMIPQLDTSNGTDFSYMFHQSRNLKDIPQLDTSKGTTFSSMFYGCSALETVSLTTAKSNLSTNTFQGCTALKNLTIGEGWNVNIYLHYSNNLTVESLHGMIENLADLTGSTAKTFQIGATNLAKIDEEHINMLKAKNWNYS